MPAERPAEDEPRFATETAAPGLVLVADDQADVRSALELLLRSAGFASVAVDSPARVLQALAERDFDALLLDMNYARDTTSGREGLELLERITELDATLPVVVITAWGSVEGAVEALRRGARDYVQKPWDNTRLLATLRSQVELGRAMRSTRRLEETARRLRAAGLPELVAESTAMRAVVELLHRVAPSEANVLIGGEHGTGKEVVARWLHHLSKRSEKPLITVNAGALPDGVFESEFFGHVRGAFTDAVADRAGCFEMADGGTLFLDEIGSLPLQQQAKLLRVLQTGEFSPIGSSKVRRCDVRLVCATNNDLPAMVEAGEFREDLFYRLNTVVLELAPLRERREDLPPLAHHFLESQAAHHGKALEGFEPEALQALLDHHWPGNVRELEHAVERGVLFAAGDRVCAADLALSSPGASRSAEQAALPEMTLDEAERYLIRRAMERFDGNVSRVARALGLSRSALYRRLQRHDDCSQNPT